ncbi:MAG TPA: polysaccharide biosynthesis/export family protein [Bosea sp. (in: a-proteobacteria)]|jgi:polysaccharide export outer membrane protein|nr:polysaccharide biosynthesis/export family protein [Bosea sp. (in: a-proteobacteria)]
MRKNVVVVVGLAALTGCSALPSSGPTAEDVVEQAAVAEQQRYEVVDITPEVVNVLARRAPDSFQASFGTHQPPAESVVGVGDFVVLTVWEASSGGLFSAPMVTDRFTTGSKSAAIPEQPVGRDGSISVPYGGRVRVAGFSIDEAQKRIVASLEGKAIQPQVQLTVTRAVSSSVTVAGEVATGARVPLSTRGDRLMDVIAGAGGIRIPVNEAVVQVTRGQRSARVAMTRIVSDPRENIFVRSSDLITVVREPQTFIAYGATGRNAEIPFETDAIKLSQALAKAGGLIDNRSDPSGVFILRYEPYAVARSLVPASPLLQQGRSVPIVYRLNLRDTSGLFLAERFPIHARDLLYVSNAQLSDLQKALQLFYLVAGPAISGASIYNVTR